MSQAFAGRRVLIVEDESLVAMLLETILEDMGCVPVGPAATVDEGLRMASEPVENTNGYGEGGLPDEWRGHSTLQKPFTEAAVRDALMTAMGLADV